MSIQLHRCMIVVIFQAEQAKAAGWRQVSIISTGKWHYGMPDHDIRPAMMTAYEDARKLLPVYSTALMSLDAVNNGPAIYQEFQSSVVTNLTLEGILNILPIAKALNQPGMFRQYTFGSDQATAWIPPSGAYLLLPDLDAIHNLLIEALSN